MLNKKILKFSMMSLVAAGSGFAIVDAATSCRTAEYDTRAEIRTTSVADYYDFFSSKKCSQMISPKPTKDYSMGFDEQSPIPSGGLGAEDFSPYWNTGNYHWGQYSDEIINQMTAGDMVVFMMVCMNFYFVESTGFLNNFDFAYAKAVKMPLAGGHSSFVVDWGFRYHNDEGHSEQLDFHTDNFRGIWICDDDIEVSLGGNDATIDIGCYSTGINADASTPISSGSTALAGIWTQTMTTNDNEPVVTGPEKVHMLSLENPFRLVFPTYKIPEYVSVL